MLKAASVFTGIITFLFTSVLTSTLDTRHGNRALVASLVFSSREVPNNGIQGQHLAIEPSRSAPRASCV